MVSDQAASGWLQAQAAAYHPLERRTESYERSAGGAERQREAFKGCAREASKDAEGEGAEVGKRFASARAG